MYSMNAQKIQDVSIQIKTRHLQPGVEDDNMVK